VSESISLSDVARVLNFNPSQSRDSVGRWTSGAGSGKVSITKSGKLTQDENGAIDSFSGSWGHVINRMLRTGEIDQPKSAEFKKMSDNLDSAISKSTLNKETTLYRGIKFQTNTTKSTYSGPSQKAGAVTKAQKDLFEGSEGKVIENPGFTSTTTSRQSALNFAKAGEFEGSSVNKAPELSSYVLELKVPKGTKALDMGGTGVFQQALVGHEKELLLPRGMKMKVESITDLGEYNPGVGISPKSTMRVVKATLIKD